MRDLINHCRVCGYDFGEPPWGDDGEHPTYLICPCCGAEIGLNDETPEQARELRKHWIEVEGAKWFSPKEKPDGWNLEEQLKNIPEEFR